jgi:hypothetical protein
MARIGVDGNDVPYVAYLTSTNRLEVKSYVNNSWNLVGGGPVTILGNIFSLAVSASGNVFIAYSDGDANFRATVWTNDGGNSWRRLGGAGGATLATTDNQVYVALDSNGLPYLAYLFDAIGEISVRKWNGNVWQDVGTPEFSSTTPDFSFGFGVSGKNVPITVFKDASTGYLKAMGFMGGVWRDMGTTGIGSEGLDVVMAINRDGVPYGGANFLPGIGPAVAKFSFAP